METIPKADCQNIGFFRKTHGIQGELILEFEPQFEYSVEDATRFFVEMEGLLVPFFIEDDGLRFRTGNTAIIELKWVDTESYAKRLVGNKVYLYLSEIVDVDDESTKHSLENYLLFDEHKVEIGVIKRVDDYSGNVVMTVDHHGEEMLIPYNEDLLKEINDTLKTISLKLPEGLLDS